MTPNEIMQWSCAALSASLAIMLSLLALCAIGALIGAVIDFIKD